MLEFDAFDGWWEGDEPSIGHPRDPFHRIDILDSSLHVASSSTASYSLNRPDRICCPRRCCPSASAPHEDVTAKLVASATRTTCAYEGRLIAVVYAALPTHRLAI